MSKVTNSSASTTGTNITHGTITKDISTSSTKSNGNHPGIISANTLHSPNPAVLGDSNPAVHTNLQCIKIYNIMLSQQLCQLLELHQLKNLSEKAEAIQTQINDIRCRLSAFKKYDPEIVAPKRFPISIISTFYPIFFIPPA